MSQKILRKVDEEEEEEVEVEEEEEEVEDEEAEEESEVGEEDQIRRLWKTTMGLLKILLKMIVTAGRKN